MDEIHRTGGKTMFRKNLSLFLIGSLMLSHFAAPSAFAKTKQEKEAASVAKVKATVAKLGAGKDTKIFVKLRDNTKLNGYVRRIEEDAFVVADAKTGAETRIAYGDVRYARGKNLSTGALIAITVGTGVGATLLVIALVLRAVYND
jgi:hypothetical protein